MLSCTAVVNISISTIMFVMFVWCVREWRSRTRPSWNVIRSRGPVCCLGMDSVQAQFANFATNGFVLFSLTECSGQDWRVYRW